MSLHVKDGVTLPSDARRRAVRERRGRGGRHRRAGRRSRPRTGTPGIELADRRVRPRRGRRRARPSGTATRTCEQRARPRIAGVTAARPARVGIVGCGNVTDLYLRGRDRACRRSTSPHARTSMPDARRRRSRPRAASRPCRSRRSSPTPSIEIVLNLTPPTAHAGVRGPRSPPASTSTREKPLATTLADAPRDPRRRRGGRASASVARRTRSSAAGLQTARARRWTPGAIGRALVANAAVMHLGPERWHPNPAFFYGPGGGPAARRRAVLRRGAGRPARPDRGVSRRSARGIGDERRDRRPGPGRARPSSPRSRRTSSPRYAFASGVDRRLQCVVRRRGQRRPGHRDPRHGRVAEPWRPEHLRWARRAAAPATTTRGSTCRCASTATIGRGIGLNDMIEAIRDEPPAIARPAPSRSTCSRCCWRPSGAASGPIVTVDGRERSASAAGPPPA